MINSSDEEESSYYADSDNDTLKRRTEYIAKLRPLKKRKQLDLSSLSLSDESPLDESSFNESLFEQSVLDESVEQSPLEQSVEQSSFDDKSDEEYIPITDSSALRIIAMCNILSPYDRTKYRRIVYDIVTVLKPPKVREILDLTIPVQAKIEVINLYLDLSKWCIFTPEYGRTLKLLQNKISYLKDPNNQIKINMVDDFFATKQQQYIDMTTRILTCDHSDEIKSIIYDKYTNSTCDKYRAWIEYALKLPTKMKPLPEMNQCDLINLFRTKLNKYIYGMDNIKEELLALVATMLSSKINKSGRATKNKIIGLVGPPGIGKTMIARALADIFELPLEQISLGGANDSSVLEGHSFTYEGSEPGMIVKSIIKMKCTNGIFYFDEVEKTANHRSREVQHSLLHILDFTQNHDFRDKYITEIPIDLSNCVFILSMNSLDDMDSALKSRIPIVEFQGYTNQEKNIIFKQFLLPEILLNYDIDKKNIKVPHMVRQYIINKTVEEGHKNDRSGVRGLKNNIDKLIKHINLRFITNEIKYPYTVSINIMDKLLDTPRNKMDTYIKNMMYT